MTYLMTSPGFPGLLTFGPAFGNLIEMIEEEIRTVITQVNMLIDGFTSLFHGSHKYRMNNDVFRIFSCCHIIKGYNRALIIDSQRSAYYTIPLGMYEILVNYNNKTIKDVEQHYNSEEKGIIEDYFKFLFENEIIFSSPKDLNIAFTSINDEFDYPATISNAILSLNGFESNLHSILSQLVKLSCYFVEINIKKAINTFELEQILSICAMLEMEDIHLRIKLKEEINFSYFKSKYVFLNSVVVYQDPEMYEDFDEEFDFRLTKVTWDLSDDKHCGVIKSNYFMPNLPHYTESLHHNTCLNRKIAIDAEGNIKNCPSMKESFGNIKDTTLEEAVNKPGFKKYWNIKKDEITKCKDCEFRHVCTDCRAYLDKPDDMYSAPLKCGYNPYTCEWEEWSTNPLKQKAIDYYGMKSILDFG